MGRMFGWFAAALIALALACPAAAQTTRHQAHQRSRATPQGAEAGQNYLQNNTPSWLTLGPGASTGGANNYVTGTFDPSTPIQGTISGFRGQDRVIPRTGDPGAPLITR